MKPLKKPLALRKETVRHLSIAELAAPRGGLVPINAPDSAYTCRTLVSCRLECILDTTVITACR